MDFKDSLKQIKKEIKENEEQKQKQEEELKILEKEKELLNDFVKFMENDKL